MSDPAVEAAQRAWDETDGFGFDSSRDAMEESAREALAPIRDEIEDMREGEAEVGDEFGSDFGAGVKYALNRVAKHVYPSEEL